MLISATTALAYTKGIIHTLVFAQAVLMVGFHEDEIQAFRSVMLDMEADMVKVRLGNKAIFKASTLTSF